MQTQEPYTRKHWDLAVNGKMTAQALDALSEHLAKKMRFLLLAMGPARAQHASIRIGQAFNRTLEECGVTEESLERAGRQMAKHTAKQMTVAELRKDPEFGYHFKDELKGFKSSQVVNLTTETYEGWPVHLAGMTAVNHKLIRLILPDGTSTEITQTGYGGDISHS